MKKLLKYNIPVACICLAVIAVLSVWLGTLIKVSSLKRSAVKAFEKSTLLYGCPKDDLNKLSGQIIQLYAIGKSVSADGCENDFASEFANVCSSMTDVGECYGKIKVSTGIVYNSILVSPQATEQQKTSAKLYFAEINSIMKQLEKSKKYNDAAKKYNSAIESLIPGLLFDGDKACVF